MITANFAVNQREGLAVGHFVTMRRHNERLESIRSNRLLQHRSRLWHDMGWMDGSVTPYGMSPSLDRKLRFPTSGAVQGAKEGSHPTFAAKVSGQLAASNLAKIRHLKLYPILLPNGRQTKSTGHSISRLSYATNRPQKEIHVQPVEWPRRKPTAVIHPPLLWQQRRETRTFPLSQLSPADPVVSYVSVAQSAVSKH